MISRDIFYRLASFISRYVPTVPSYAFYTLSSVISEQYLPLRSARRRETGERRWNDRGSIIPGPAGGYVTLRSRRCSTKLSCLHPPDVRYSSHFIGQEASPTGAIDTHNRYWCVHHSQRKHSIPFRCSYMPRVGARARIANHGIHSVFLGHIPCFLPKQLPCH